MLEDFEQKRRKQITNTRSLVNYVMGILFILFGIYFLTYNLWGGNIFNIEPSAIDYLIGALFILYGGWRVYRGYKKNYFVE